MLCLKSHADVANFRTILAMTFTNAAANEMKERIVNDLCDIVGNARPEGIQADLIKELGITADELKHNAQSLLTCIMHDYSSFCVCTIDAFVQKLSRSFAHELGLSAQYAVSIDEKEMANAVVDNLGAQISDENAFLAKIVTDFCNNRFDSNHSINLKESVADFVAKLMTEEAFQRDENNNILNLEQYKETEAFLNGKLQRFEDQMKKLSDQFRDFEKRHDFCDKDYYRGAGGFVSCFNKMAKRDYKPATRYFRDAATEGVWCSKNNEKRFSNSELDAMTAELTPILRSVLHCLDTELPAYQFYKSQRDLLCLYALRTKIRDEFKKISDEDEIVHISEFNKLINNVLGDYSVPFVYEKVGEKFRHVFVDEFQDTSIMQWQNLLPLIDNGLSTNAMSMVVGDGKQSIYRFRSGEVGQIVSLPEIYALPDDERYEAFAQYQRNLVAHFGFHQLDTNRRSFENVVNFNNDFFGKTYKYLSEAHQRVYIDVDDKHNKEVSVKQKTHKKEKGFVQVQLFDNEDNEFCLCSIKQLIGELLKKGYSYSDIAILTRETKLGSLIANYLNDNGISVISRDSILLKSSDKVRLMVNTLRYLIERANVSVVANVVYLYHLVFSPDFEGELSGLFDAVSDIAHGKVAIETELGIGEPGLLFGIMAKATCLYDLCASLLRLFGLDALNDAFLDYFMDEVFKWQSGVQESIVDFLAFWEKKSNKLSISPSNTDAVSIVTIHKSKGLQFPVVIYPQAITDLNFRLGGNSKVEEIWVKPESLGFEAIPNLEKVILKLSKKAEEMGGQAAAYLQKESDDLRLDNLNLLYVAFTRAMQRLYVLAPAGGKENVISDYLASDTLPEGMTVTEEGRLLQYGNPDFHNPTPKEQADSGVTVMGEGKEAEPSCNWFAKINLDAAPSMFWMSPDDKMSPSEWGELVHAMLSKVEKAADIDHALQPYLMEGLIDGDMAELLKHKLSQMCHHALIGKAFADDAKVKNECDILCDGEIMRPDRYAELHDEIILLDYKTGKKDPKHHRQLKNYIVALREMVDKEIRAYLVYLTDPVEVEAVLMDTLF